MRKAIAPLFGAGCVLNEYYAFILARTFAIPANIVWACLRVGEKGIQQTAISGHLCPHLHFISSTKLYLGTLYKCQCGYKAAYNQSNS